MGINNRTKRVEDMKTDIEYFNNKISVLLSCGGGENFVQNLPNEVTVDG